MRPFQDSSTVVMLSPVAAASTARTANLDTQGAHNATILVTLGAELNTNGTNVAMTLSESDDQVATNFATFNADFNRTIDNTAGTVAVNHLDLRGRKRYIRLTLTPGTTTNDVVISSAVAILDKEVRDAIADSGNDVVRG